MKPIVELTNVNMRFTLYYERLDTLKEAMLSFVRGTRKYRYLDAVSDVSLSISPGQSVGLVGRNGSGKSTLLKIIAGVYQPTSGTRIVRGNVAALIELGAGFNGELTGRENVFLNGALMGLPPRIIRERYDRIVDFAELRDFMDVPVKNYSSGMYARLAFAIATDVDATILVLDEILGVGDEAFQLKCRKRIDDFRKAGCTILFVSHDAASVAQICDRAIVMEHGKVGFDGDTKSALEYYQRAPEALQSVS